MDFLYFITGPSAKLSFLDFLLINSKNNKILPMDLNDKVNLISSLLNSRVVEFDFLTLGSLVEYNLHKITKNVWETACKYIWSVLAKNCPDLQMLKEAIPAQEEYIDEYFKTTVGPHLNGNITHFPKLICLETYCSIDSGWSKIF
jgi:hypothetical protein